MTLTAYTSHTQKCEIIGRYLKDTVSNLTAEESCCVCGGGTCCGPTYNINSDTVTVEIEPKHSEHWQRKICYPYHGEKESNNNPTGSQNEAQRISELMLEKKALDIIIIDVRKITTLTDFFVVCTSESEPQTRAITDHINQTMKEEGVKSWHIEGYEYLDWVLVDYVNIVAHIFSKNAREYYEFERLWADGIITQIQDKE